MARPKSGKPHSSCITSFRGIAPYLKNGISLVATITGRTQAEVIEAAFHQYVLQQFNAGRLTDQQRGIALGQAGYAKVIRDTTTREGNPGGRE